jgi:hypothetical protein
MDCANLFQRFPMPYVVWLYLVDIGGIVYKHCFVLLNILAFLQLYVDMTFGAGGHTKQILQRAPDARVICLDQDPTAHK